MRYHQPQGYFRLYTTQLRESAQNNQDCQIPSLFRQPILQTARLSQNPDCQKSGVQKSGNKQAQRCPRGRRGDQQGGARRLCRRRCRRCPLSCGMDRQGRKAVGGFGMMWWTTAAGRGGQAHIYRRVERRTHASFHDPDSESSGNWQRVMSEFLDRRASVWGGRGWRNFLKKNDI